MGWGGGSFPSPSGLTEMQVTQNPAVKEACKRHVSARARISAAGKYVYLFVRFFPDKVLISFFVLSKGPQRTG